jgi:uncharacterized RDD family membrane protein YckC
MIDRSTHEAPAPIDTTTDVETPEHIRFRYRAAGPSRRALAYLLDLLIRIAIGFVLVVLAVAAGAVTDGSGGLLFLGAFLLEWGYYVLFESLWGGRTLGKRVMSLRVVKEGGYPITFVDSLLRNLLRAADFLPAVYAIGLFVMARDSRFRRLGDRVAGTLVVIEEPTRVSAAVDIAPPPTAAELATIPARPRLSAAELEAIELFLRRRGTLAPAREEELAEMIAPALAQRLGLDRRDPSRLLALLYHRATRRGDA